MIGCGYFNSIIGIVEAHALADAECLGTVNGYLACAGIGADDLLDADTLNAAPPVAEKHFSGSRDVVADTSRDLPFYLAVGALRRGGKVLRLIPALVSCISTFAVYRNAAAALELSDITAVGIDNECKRGNNVALLDKISKRELDSIAALFSAYCPADCDLRAELCGNGLDRTYMLCS